MLDIDHGFVIQEKLRVACTFFLLNGEMYCCIWGNSQIFENDFTTQGWSPNDSSFVLEIVQNLISLFEIREGYKKVFMFGVGGSAGHFG